tara:strand:+ start:355 stop:603 length:249 start_codon:yes stop_codon:yes gene_type:complete
MLKRFDKTKHSPCGGITGHQNSRAVSAGGARPMTNLEEQRKLEAKIDGLEQQLAALKLEQLERVFSILQNQKDKEHQNDNHT